MPPRPILSFPDPRLRVAAAPVTRFDADLRELAADLLDTMRAAPGIGITAPHDGGAQRLVGVGVAAAWVTGEERGDFDEGAAATGWSFGDLPAGCCFGDLPPCPAPPFACACCCCCLCASFRSAKMRFRRFWICLSSAKRISVATCSARAQ